MKNILDLVGKKIRELVEHPPFISLDQNIFNQPEGALIDFIPSPNNDDQDDSFSEEKEQLKYLINHILTNFETKQKEIAFYHFALIFN